MDDVTTMVLTPRAADSVSIPVIAGGGIADARGLVAALALGADGVVMGTRFVATRECLAHTNYKDWMVGAGETDTMMIQRSIRNATRILVPIDGSPGSSLAVDHCIELLGKIRPQKIVLLHIASIPGQLEQYSGKLGAALYKMKEQLQEHGDEILADAKSKIEQSSPGIAVETKMVWGDTKYEIVRESEESGCDLLIIGSRGFSRVKVFLMGSVSSYVAQNVKCTVTIVKASTR